MSIKFVLIGNVDNGKSTLGSRLLISSGNISEDEIYKAKKEADKYKKGTFWLAYLLDIDDVERDRGITLGYTTYDFKYADKDLRLIDVPGHRDLVQEMVTGASIANVALLVLSAKLGEYEASLKGQAMEHTLIARGLGISTLIVVINKMDESTNEEYERIKLDISQKIKKFRFKTVKFVNVSAYYGTNIDQLLDLLINIDIENPKDKCVNIKNNKIIKTKFIFDNIPTLITAGFKCICHSKENHFNVEFVEIKNDKHNFVTHSNSIDKNGLPKLIDVQIQILDDIDTVSSNLVIRYQNQTIGLARVI